MKEWGQVLVAETSGNLKLLNHEMEILEEYELGSRIRNMSYRMGNGQLKLELNNFNNTLAQFNVTTSQYGYVSRQHSGDVLGLAYLSKLSKVVSISKDNTIRIWGLQVNNNDGGHSSNVNINNSSNINSGNVNSGRNSGLGW